MTPKLKAEELVQKFIEHTMEWDENRLIYVKDEISAKLCAIICVEEILWAKNNTRPSEKKFWEDVLEELKNMN